jgi:hypothetical protein
MPGGRGNLLNRMPGGSFMGGNAMGRGGSSSPFKDSLLHRTGLEDSATIIYRYLDTTRFFSLDSSVNDFTRRWPVPWTNIVLGNNGSASRSLLFSPNMKPGWDHGMHAFDPYMVQEKNIRFYNTTRPYTQMVYVLGSKAEQNISVFHTQNIRYNWNFSFYYNLINSPGIFKNQKNNHNNYVFNTWYTGPKRRYSFFFFTAANRLGASENGGLSDLNLLNDLPAFSTRFNLPTNLGGSSFESQTFLSNTINTGNIYKTTQLLWRHYYDLGKQDSVTTDSSTVYFFYPRLRFQHTIRYNRYSFQYKDVRTDENGYRKLYGLSLIPTEFSIQDFWKIFDNELAIYQFPDIKNQQQFFKAAGGFQTLNADFGVNEPSFANVYVNGEYRNKTKNKKWDIELAGTFFAAGTYAGDYRVQASLKRLIGKKLGYLTLGFQNVNRTPSFVHDDRSNFKRFNIGNTNFNKENTTVVSALYDLPQQQLSIGAHYYLAGNYTYFKSYTEGAQESTLFNVLQFQLQKQFKLSRVWNWYTELYVQQSTAKAPVNLPLLFTRNRLAYEGKFFKNLNLSTGLELRYHTPFKMDGYSPVLGQFFLQNDTTINNLPDVTAYLHFRVRSFYMFVRAENLNSVQFSQGFGFFNNNFSAPLQPMPGLIMRFGIYWGFVN